MATERRLPEGVVPSSRTATFSAASVPPALLTHHNTRAGTWGVLTVETGTVRYFVDGSDTPLATVGRGETHIILPEERHYVRPSDDARFFVTFHRKPTQQRPADSA